MWRCRYKTEELDRWKEKGTYLEAGAMMDVSPFLKPRVVMISSGPGLMQFLNN